MVRNFRPIGPPGPQGPQGPTGIQGPAGAGIPTVQNGKFLFGSGGAAEWAGLDSYATTLPTGVDGQRVTLVDNVTNPSYQWEFRYNSQSTSTYKWEFVGGNQRYATGYMGAWQLFSGSSNWVNGSPGFVVPRAGEYTVSIAAQFYAGSGGILIQFATGPASVGAVNPVSVSAPANGWTTGLAHNVMFSIAAGGTINAWYWANAAAYVANAGMFVQPVRVS